MAIWSARPAVPFFLGAIVVGWLAWVRAALGWAPILCVTRIPQWSGIMIAVVLGVLRDLTPFAALAA